MGARDPVGGWREEVIGASGLNLLAGIWLIIAPFVLGYNGNTVWNDVVCGIIVAVLALSRVLGLHRASWISWLNAIVGVWLFVSAFWLDQTATASWNDVILGIIVVVLAAWSASASEAANAPVEAIAPEEERIREEERMRGREEERIREERLQRRQGPPRHGGAAHPGHP